jgi:hypothetical protein
VRAGKGWIAEDAIGGWPAGTVFLDAAGARAAAAAAAPGMPVAAVAAPPPAAKPLAPPRVAIYKSWAASMDEGWTRFVLEQHGFAPRTLDNKAVRAGSLAASYDAIVLPDQPKEVIATGRPKRDEGEMQYFEELPAEYAGGLDKAGAEALRAFVKAGGTLVALSAATEYAIDELALPVRNAVAKVARADLAVPGSLLRAHVAAGHPVTAGLPPEVAVFQDKPIAFETAVPGPDIERRVLAAYPADRRDVLLSGFLEGGERLERRAAAVALTWGRGKVVLLGFRPQHRAQMEATFPFLFNALWWSARR